MSHQIMSDDGLYSDDEDEEGRWAGETHGEEGAEVGYAEVATLCMPGKGRMRG